MSFFGGKNTNLWMPSFLSLSLLINSISSHSLNLPLSSYVQCNYNYNIFVMFYWFGTNKPSLEWHVFLLLLDIYTSFLEKSLWSSLEKHEWIQHSSFDSHMVTQYLHSIKYILLLHCFTFQQLLSLHGELFRHWSYITHTNAR